MISKVFQIIARRNKNNRLMTGTNQTQFGFIAKNLTLTNDKNRPLNLRQMTYQSIEKAQTLKQLIVGVNMHKFADKQAFRPFMRKLAKLLQRSEDPEIVSAIEIFLTQLRRFSSAELTSNSSDLLNYQLLFKKLKYCFPDHLRFEGFEQRVTMLVEGMPRTFSFEDIQSKSVALLHYMTTFTELSGVETKKSLSNYFLRYFVNKNTLSGYVRQKVGPDFLKFQNDANFNHDTCAILLSCVNMRSTKIPYQAFLDQLAVTNINKFWSQIRDRIKTSIIDLIFKKSHKIERKQMLKELKQYTVSLKNSEFLVLNSLQPFLQCVDIFNNLLKANRTFLLKVEIAGFAAIQDLSVYFQMILALYPDMQIPLFKENYQINKNPSSIEFKKELQIMNLWKISADFVQNMVAESIYVARRANILKQILSHTINYLQQPQKQDQYIFKKSMKQKIFTVSQYAPQILRILTYMPQVIVLEQKQNNKNYSQNIVNLLTQIVQNIPIHSENRKNYQFSVGQNWLKSIKQHLINLYHYKGQTIVEKNQWFKLFQTLASQDKGLVHWDLYFFLADESKKTKNIKMEKLIPMNELVMKLNSLKKTLPKQASSQQKESQTAQEQEFTVKNMKNGQNRGNKQISYKQHEKKFMNVCKVHEFQTELLRFYALSMMLNKQHKYFDEETLPVTQTIISEENDEQNNIKSKKTRKSKKEDEKLMVSKVQFKKIFDSWMEPFNFSLLSQLQGTIYAFKDFLYKLKPQNHYLKPIGFYQNMYHKVFVDTRMPYQSRLINKILQHRKFAAYIEGSQVCPNINFHAYAKTLLVGLTDTENKELIQKRFPYDQKITEDLRTSSAFSQFKTIFKSWVVNEDQWRYILDIFNGKDQISPARNFFIEFISYYRMQSACMSEESKKTKEFVIKKEEYAKIINAIITYLLNDARSDRNYKQTRIRKVCEFINFLFYVGIRKDIKSKIMNEEQKKQIIELFTSLDLNSAEKEVSLCICKLDVMGFIDNNIATKMLKNIRFTELHDIGNIILRSYTDEEIPEEKKKIIVENIFKISSIIRHSPSALIACIRVSPPFNVTYMKLAHAILRFYDPEQRLILLQQLMKKQQKQKIPKYDNFIEDNIKSTKREIDEYKKYIQVDQTISMNQIQQILQKEEENSEIQDSTREQIIRKYELSSPNKYEKNNTSQTKNYVQNSAKSETFKIKNKEYQAKEDSFKKPTAIKQNKKAFFGKND